MADTRDIWARAFAAQLGEMHEASEMPEYDNPPFLVKIKRSGKEYTLRAIGGDIAVISQRTGRWWSMPKDKLINIAVECGIDRGSPVDRGGPHESEGTDQDAEEASAGEGDPNPGVPDGGQ